MIDININDETSQLKTVVLGIADDFGGTPSLDECYDPKSKEHVLNSTFPVEEDCVSELNNFKNILKKYNVNVFRPVNILKLNQIFSRDIAFVIENKLFVSNIIIDRAKEVNAIDYIIKKIPSKDVIQIPSDAKIEGGDVILHKDYIFIGYSKKEEFNKYTVARTNKKGLDFISACFPNKKIIGFELKKSDVNARKNALHLDCCFQPIGKNMAIIYKKGFKNQEDIDFLINFFGCDNLIDLSTQEMYDMNSNIFSISEDVIVSEKSFIRLNNVLRSKGFVVEEVSFNEISKMEGLLRCSTMPLLRK